VEVAVTSKEPRGQLLRNVLFVASYPFWAIVFAICYTQAPLYYSNQNQYFLHGAAQAGLGLLDHDWLSTTADPTPVFTAVIRLTFQHVGPWAFYIYYGLLLGLYFLSLVRIATLVFPQLDDLRVRVVFITGLLLVHSAAARLFCALCLGSDYLWYVQAGLAGQYVLGPVFQPSAFGVLLILSITFFVEERPLLATLTAALAADFHATYLPAAATLVLAYLVPLLVKRRFRSAALIGALAWIVVLPVVVYNLVVFQPSSPEAFQDAQILLAHFRIPHHAQPIAWFDASSFLQLAGICGAAWLMRKSVLAPIFGVSLAVLGVLTLVQIFGDSDTLALLFPWRLSVYLVPLSTMVLLARLTIFVMNREWAQGPGTTRYIFIGSAVVVAVLVMAGGCIQWTHTGFNFSEDGVPLMAHVRSDAIAGDVYLLPTELPTKTMSNGSPMSLANRPPSPERAMGSLQFFRLGAQAPIYVDFKSIPYKDSDVEEWYRRLLVTLQVYDDLRTNRADEAEALCRSEHVTHIVTLLDTPIKEKHQAFQRVYEDKVFRVYRVQSR
jgi:hypothetical protein